MHCFHVYTLSCHVHYQVANATSVVHYHVPPIRAKEVLKVYMFYEVVFPGDMSTIDTYLPSVLSCGSLLLQPLYKLWAVPHLPPPLPAPVRPQGLPPHAGQAPQGVSSVAVVDKYLENIMER